MPKDFDFKKSLEKDLKQASMPPLPFAEQMKREEDAKEAEKKVENIMKKEGLLTVEEGKILLGEIKRKQEAIKRKLDEMYEERGVTPDYLKMYMSNPSNFNPEEWQEINTQREALVDSLNLPSELKETAGSANAPQSSQRGKGRRDKTAASRRRNWLPM